MPASKISTYLYSNYQEFQYLSNVEAEIKRKLQVELHIFWNICILKVQKIEQDNNCN